MFSLSSVFFKLSSTLTAVHYFKIGLKFATVSKLIQYGALQGKKNDTSFCSWTQIASDYLALNVLLILFLLKAPVYLLLIVSSIKLKRVPFL